MVESAREVCDSVKVREKNPKRVWWNDEIQAAVRRKEAAWEEVLERGKTKVYGNVQKRKEKGLKVYNSEQKKVNEKLERR